MALFSKQNKEVFTNPLNLDHPILGQVLELKKDRNMKVFTLP